MNPLIENNREAIYGLCRRHGVKRLEVFGSILRDDFDARGKSSKVYNIAIQHAPELLAAVREALKAFPEPAP